MSKVSLVGVPKLKDVNQQVVVERVDRYDGERQQHDGQHDRLALQISLLYLEQKVEWQHDRDDAHIQARQPCDLGLLAQEQQQSLGGGPEDDQRYA